MEKLDNWRIGFEHDGEFFLLINSATDSVCYSEGVAFEAMEQLRDVDSATMYVRDPEGDTIIMSFNATQYAKLVLVAARYQGE